MIEQIKNKLKTISLKHKQIKSFDHGEDFLVSTKDTIYPISFLEIPYNFDYPTEDNQTFRFKTFSFALLVLMEPNHNDSEADHVAISQAEGIAEAIIFKLKSEIESIGFTLVSANGISLRNFSKDDVSGVRFDLTLQGFLECNYNDQFEDF